MPDLTRLAAELAAMRTGHGPRRAELRQRLAAVDPVLRRTRNIEMLRLAQFQHLLRTSDTRRSDSASLRQAVEQSTVRLAALDLRIVEAIAARGK